VSFFIRHRFGGQDRDPAISVFPALLDELAYGDPEHPEVALVDDTGLALSVFASELVVIENVETGDPGPRHLRCTDRDHVLRLLTALANQRYAELEAEAWTPGYG